MAGKISMGARREVVSAVTERYQSVKRAEKGRILDALCATTGWHRKHAVRALRRHPDRGPIARGCGRLGLCRARPAHSPSHRASLESPLARPITRHQIDRCKGAIRVTFADEAIRLVKSQADSQPE
jgi:hypothetical protein